jgi:hypothetical protein
MAIHVLMHGAWHGNWCWYRIVTRLKRADNRVLAPDLAAMGRDRAPVGSIMPCQRFTLDTDHSPLDSRPDELTAGIAASSDVMPRDDRRYIAD